MVGRIRAVETVALGWGKLSKTKTLKGGGIEKRGGGTKILERGQAGSRGGYLKKGEHGPPYELWPWTSSEHRIFRNLTL